MRYSLLTALILVLIACEDVADCNDPYSNDIGLAFYSRDKEDSAVFLLLDSVYSDQYLFLDSTFRASTLGLIVDPTNTLTHFYFVYRDTVNFDTLSTFIDTLSVRYHEKAALPSLECGPQARLQELSITQNSFSGGEVVGSTLTTNPTINIEIYY